jgi:hypothetical protein
MITSARPYASGYVFGHRFTEQSWHDFYTAFFGNTTHVHAGINANGTGTICTELINQVTIIAANLNGQFDCAHTSLHSVGIFVPVALAVWLLLEV